MEKNDFRVSTTELAHWFNAIRNIDSHRERNRALDAVWSGQLESKAWLVNHVVDCVMRGAPVNIYVFGGWIGILSSMLLQSDIHVKQIRSIDIDPWCERIANDVNKRHEMDGWRFRAETADMSYYEYPEDAKPDIVINTSAEHITQEAYDDWYDEIPRGTLVVVQGNNYFDCPEHIRCSKNLNEFMAQSRVDSPYYKGELQTDMYTRYMCVWRKECS